MVAVEGGWRHLFPPSQRLLSEIHHFLFVVRFVFLDTSNNEKELNQIYIICTLTIFEELSSLDEKDFFPQKYAVNNSFHSLINFRVCVYFYKRDFHEVQFTFYNKWTTPPLSIDFNVNVKVQKIDNIIMITLNIPFSIKEMNFKNKQNTIVLYL